MLTVVRCETNKDGGIYIETVRDGARTGIEFASEAELKAFIGEPTLQDELRALLPSLLVDGKVEPLLIDTVLDKTFDIERKVVEK